MKFNLRRALTIEDEEKAAKLKKLLRKPKKGPSMTSSFAVLPPHEPSPEKTQQLNKLVIHHCGCLMLNCLKRFCSIK
jgi:hypothetical protein